MRKTSRAAALLMLLVAAGPTSAPVDSAEAKANCRRAAQACVDAFSRGDAGALLAAMHPAVFKLGGADLAKVREAMELTFKGFKEQGLTITCSIGDGPAELIDGGASRFALVPEFVDIRGRGGQGQRTESYLLGVSEDGGVSWRFVDGQGLNAETIARLFPDYPIATHPLPTVRPPRPVPTSQPAN